MAKKAGVSFQEATVAQQNFDDNEVMQPPSLLPNNPNRNATADRHMNDTTIAPPRKRYANKPRNKAVNPRRGFGLHDWKRLLRHSNDLAQRKGAPMRRHISKEEVRKHNKNHDAWIILRGRVYNIGPYLPYHPGGVDIFKSVLGKDASSLFEKYHRWVNIDGLIGPLLLGNVSGQSNLAPVNEGPSTIVPRLSTSEASKASLLSPATDDGDDDEEELLPPWIAYETRWCLLAANKQRLLDISLRVK